MLVVKEQDEPEVMDLRLTLMEVLAVVASVMVMQSIAHDGETHWMESVQLFAVYLILAVAFFFLTSLGRRPVSRDG